MTKKELIEALEPYDDGMEVTMHVMPYGYCPVSSVLLVDKLRKEDEEKESIIVIY